MILLLLILSLLLSPAAPVAAPSFSSSGTPSRRPSTSPSRPATRTGSPSRRPTISVSRPNTRSASRASTISVSLPNTRSASAARTVSVTLAPTRTSGASASASGAATVSGSLPVTRSQASSPSDTGSPSASGRTTVEPSQLRTVSPALSHSSCASASRSPSASNSVPSARGTPSGCASASACASASSSPSGSRSPARSQGASGSASASPSVSACASASACVSASSSQSASASRGPSPSAQGSASRCPSASATATPSASGSPSASASASAAATPSATSSAPPCSCKANALASSAGGACPTPLLSVSWPMGWRDDAQLLPNASAAEAAPASALVASWPAIRSAVTITLPFPPSAQEQVTLTCALAGAGAGSLGLFTSAPGATCAADAGSCAAVLSPAALSARFWLYATAPAPPAPLASSATLLCTATSALRGGASDRPCASAAAAPVYPRLTQLTPAPLPARNLASEWVLVGAVLAEEGPGGSVGGAAGGVFTVQGGAPAASGGGGAGGGGSVVLYLPAACASAASEAAAGGGVSAGATPAPLTLTNLSVSGSANPAACAAALQAPLAQLRAQAAGAPTPTFSFTTGVASHLLLVAPPLADFPAGGVGAALGAIGLSGLLCRGPRDAPCDAASPTCCRVNWATPTVLSLSTPPYGEGAQSLCGGAAWCQVPLSLFALPHGADANASSGSPFFNSSAVGASGERSPLAQQLWGAASSAVAPSALYPPTVFPPTPLTLARSASAWPLACAAQPPPPSPAALFACLNASGLALDLAPPPPPLQRLAASAFPACTGLCLSQQCSGFAPLQSCGLVTAAARPCAPPPAPPCYQQLALEAPASASTAAPPPASLPCAYGSGSRCAACAPSPAAVCPGGNALYVQPGHWAPPPDASGYYDLTQLVPCGPPLPASRCTGAPPGALPGCAPGYAGYACSACASGYFTASSDPGAPPGSACARCPSMATYLDLALSFSGFVGQLGGGALALYAGAAGALRACGEAPHRAVPLPALLRFLALRVLSLLLWVVVFSQQASLLFSSVQALSVDALRGVFELLAVLQFRGLRSPNSQCLSVPFPFVWASATAVGLCYATVAGALGVWQCRRSCAAAAGAASSSSAAPGVLSSAPSSSSSASAAAPPPDKPAPAPAPAPAAACCALLRAAPAALPRAAALLLTLAYGTLTSVFAAVVTCTPPEPMLYSAYLGIGGDGSSLPPGALPPPGAPPPNATLTVPVSLLASNPYQVCWEGAHRPAAVMGLACLLAYSLAFPLGTLLLLRARGKGCYASFCAPLPAGAAGGGAADGEPSGCYACRRCRRHGRQQQQQLTAGPGVQYVLEDEEGGLAVAEAGAALAAAGSASEWLRQLLRMPELRDGFLSLHQLALAAIALLLALPLAVPRAALGADVTLVLLTAAASVAIKQHFKPFQRSGSKWSNSTLSAFYAVTAFTALMLAVSRNTPRLSTASSWALSLLAILSGVLALCFVLYKWAVALCRSGRVVGSGGSGALGGAAGAGAAAVVMTPNPLLQLPQGQGGRAAGSGGGSKTKEEEEEEEEAAAWERWSARAAAEEAAAAAALAAAAAAREAEAGAGSAQLLGSGALGAEGGEGSSGAGLQVQVDGEGSAQGATGAGGGGGGGAGGAGEPPKEEGAVSPYLERMVQRIGSELERKSAQRERRRVEKEARDAAAAAAAATACRDDIEQS